MVILTRKRLRVNLRPNTISFPAWKIKRRNIIIIFRVFLDRGDAVDSLEAESDLASQGLLRELFLSFDVAFRSPSLELNNGGAQVPEVALCYVLEAVDPLTRFIVENFIEMKSPKDDFPAPAPGIGHFIPFLRWYDINVVLAEGDKATCSIIIKIRPKIQHISQDEEIAEGQEIE